MALTPYMSLDLPVPTVTLGPEWAEQLNAALEFIDAHDHTAGKGQLITSAALNINDDVAINGHNLTLARSFNMQNLGSPIAGPADLRSIYAVNGELYYNDGNGVQIQITDSGGLNASTFGGIGGDYGPPAAVNYSSTSKSYLFYQSTTLDRLAKIETSDIILKDDVDGPINGVTLKSPASLAASYDFRFPNALPAANRILQISSVGDVDPVLITDSLVSPKSLTDASIQDGGLTNIKFAPTQVITGLIKEQFTTSGTWTRPAGVDTVFVRLVAGGGGGGGGGPYSNVGSDTGGSGGAGGSAGQIIFQPVSVAQASYTVTVGTGGAAGIAGPQLGVSTAGGGGTDSVFTGSDAYVKALGGGGGFPGIHGAPTVRPGGQPNAAFNKLSTVRFLGGKGGDSDGPGAAAQAGSAGEASPFVTVSSIDGGFGGGAGPVGSAGGGGGGACCLGLGGTGGNSGGPSSGVRTNGGNGAGYGSGGGGGGGAPSNVAPSNDPTDGGTGAPGIVEIYYAAPNL